MPGAPQQCCCGSVAVWHNGAELILYRARDGSFLRTLGTHPAGGVSGGYLYTRGVTFDYSGDLILCWTDTTGQPVNQYAWMEKVDGQSGATLWTGAISGMGFDPRPTESDDVVCGGALFSGVDGSLIHRFRPYYEDIAGDVDGDGDFYFLHPGTNDWLHSYADNYAYRWSTLISGASNFVTVGLAVAPSGQSWVSLRYGSGPPYTAGLYRYDSSGALSGGFVGAGVGAPSRPETNCHGYGSVRLTAHPSSAGYHVEVEPSVSSSGLIAGGIASMAAMDCAANTYVCTGTIIPAACELRRRGSVSYAVAIAQAVGSVAHSRLKIPSQ